MSAEEFRSRRETCEELKEDVFDTWSVRGGLERRFLATAGNIPYSRCQILKQCLVFLNKTSYGR